MFSRIQPIIILLSWSLVTSLSVIPKLTFAITEQQMAECHLMFGAIEGNKRNLRDAPIVKLPKQTEVPLLTKDESQRAYDIALAIFRKQWSDKSIEDLRKIAREGINGPIDEKNKVAFNARLKEIRSTLKHLRFIYGATGEIPKGAKVVDEETLQIVPPVLKEVTIAIGKLRDVIQGKRGAAKDLEKYSNRLLAALEPSNLVILETEIKNYRPIQKGVLEDRLKDLVRKSRKILDKNKNTPTKYHDLRKYIQSILAITQTKYFLNPIDGELRTLVDFLTQQGERLGNEHEVWEREANKGKLNYEKDKVKLPGELKSTLRDFLEKLSF